MLPCRALRDSDQAYELRTILKNQKTDVAAVCFLNILWELISFQASCCPRFLHFHVYIF